MSDYRSAEYIRDTGTNRSTLKTCQSIMFSGRNCHYFGINSQKEKKFNNLGHPRGQRDVKVGFS